MIMSQLMDRIIRKRFRPHRHLHRHLSYHGASLQEISQSLVSLASQSEQEFLSLGERLQKFSSAFKQLSRQVSLSLQKLGGTGAGDDAVLVSIRHLLESAVSVLHDQSENMARSLQYMKPVSERLYQISKMRDDFQKISRFLRILGTSIKIESTVAGDQGHEFMILAEEIDQIWSHITRNTEDLLCRAAQSAHLVDLARQRITGNWKHYQTLIGGARLSILSALAEVEEMFQLTSGAAQEIAARAQAIAQEIGEIVCSLQFHDITRQQLEHIYEALDKAGSRLHDSSGLETESVSGHWHEVEQILLVQRLQLKNVGKEMDQAGARIRIALTEIAKKLEREDRSISAFGDNTRTREVGKVQKLEHEIAQLASILNQCKGLEEEISEALKPTIQSAAQVEEYMKEMERVGYGINLLSLNALIKAAQNRASGQPFVVLAEEIHRQATLSRELSERARLGLATLMENNRALDMTLGLLSEQKSKADSIIHLTLENASRLGSLNQELNEILCVLRSKNSQLASGMVAVAQGIQFEGLFRSRITQGLADLERIQNDLQEVFQNNRCHQEESRTAGAESLADHYTMKEERRIHQQAISHPGLGVSREGEDDPKGEVDTAPEKPVAWPERELDTAPEIELYAAPEEASDTVPEKASEDNEESFGDNVELF